jgi:hypothetical protein
MLKTADKINITNDVLDIPIKIFQIVGISVSFKSHVATNHKTIKVIRTEKAGPEYFLNLFTYCNLL